MKKRYLLVFAMIGIAGIAGAADATNTPPAGSVPTNAPAVTNATAEAAPVAKTDSKPQQAAESKPDSTLGTNMLMLNFRGASLDQVLSYFSEAAGFVINVKPGTSVRGKGHISKTGDSRLRQAFYMPALTAMRFNPVLKAFAERLRQRGKTGKVVVVAVMKKLVHIIFGVLKSQKPFDPKWAQIS